MFGHENDEFDHEDEETVGHTDGDDDIGWVMGASPDESGEVACMVNVDNFIEVEKW